MENCGLHQSFLHSLRRLYRCCPYFLEQDVQSYIGNPNPLNTSFPVATDSRTLSISAMAPSSNGSAAMLLFYEAPSSNVTVLHGYLYSTPVQTPWVWHNITEAVYSTIRNLGLWLSPPLGVSGSFGGGYQTVQLAFVNVGTPSNLTTPFLTLVSYADWSNLG